MIEILVGYLIFCVIWFTLFNTVLSDGSAGSFGLSLLPLAPIIVPPVLLYVEVRDAFRDLVRG